MPATDGNVKNINAFVDDIKQAYYDLEQSTARRGRLVIQNAQLGSPDPNMPETPDPMQPMGQPGAQPPTLLEAMVKNRR
jgi:hypothetical protein